ncbi:MAG: hypothetical protein AVDCRST_MAG07-3252, partial [uncultured Frankineae bacterium]
DVHAVRAAHADAERDVPVGRARGVARVGGGRAPGDRMGRHPVRPDDRARDRCAVGRTALRL